MIPATAETKRRHRSRTAELIAHEAAQFILREAGTESLITVTHATLAPRGDRATVFVSVLPDDRVGSALAFLERQREAFSEHLKMHTRIKPLPRVDFLLDDRTPSRAETDPLP